MSNTSLDLHSGAFEFTIFVCFMLAFPFISMAVAWLVHDPVNVSMHLNMPTSLLFLYF